MAFEQHYFPQINGQSFDPAELGGSVERIRLYASAERDAGIAPPVADVASSVKVAFGDYVFAMPALAAGTYYAVVSYQPAATAAQVHDRNEVLVVYPFDGSLTGHPYTPAPEQVHALIPMRPSFTETSRPSIAEVQSLADQLVGDLDAELAAPLDERYHGLARWAITLGTASYVESGYFPEQQLGDDRPATVLWTRYLNALDRLRARLTSDAVTDPADQHFTGSLSLRQPVAFVPDVPRGSGW